jgi:hypothetical protein
MASLPGWAPADVDLDRPNVARVYDCLLGGHHHFAVDRAVAEALLSTSPLAALAARANRAFLRRAVGYALDQGIRQFLDLGSGIPTVGNVHELAHAVDPQARIVYVDVEPVAVAHTRSLLAQVPNTGVVQADIRDAEAVLGDPVTTALLDFTRPMAVLSAAVLHFVPGDLTAIVRPYRAAIAPGSLLVISHGAQLGAVRDRDEGIRVVELYKRTSTPLTPRTAEEIAAALEGLELVSPDPDAAQWDGGLVSVARWRPTGTDDEEHADSAFLAANLAAVARKH